jgi:hypothetical protein
MSESGTLTSGRRITLRDESREDGSRLVLEAYVDGDGNLHLDGHDLGPVTVSISADGEYEYFKTIAARDVPRLLGLVGAGAGEGVLDVLRRRWSGDASYDLEDLLSASDVPVELFTRSG